MSEVKMNVFRKWMKKQQEKGKCPGQEEAWREALIWVLELYKDHKYMENCGQIVPFKDAIEEELEGK